MKERTWMGWGRSVVWAAPLVALAGCQVLFGVELPAEDAAGAGAAGSAAGGGQAGAARCTLCGAFFDGAPTSAACVDNGPPTSSALATALTGCLCRPDTCGSTDCKAVCETDATPSKACRACGFEVCRAEVDACLLDDGRGSAGGVGGGSGSAGASGAGGSSTGSGGQGGSGGQQVALDEGELTFTGSSIDETRQLFPFGVAVAGNGAVFVSTLGNQDNEPSRIYRFTPGSSNAPDVLFEVANDADAAVYGLTFSKGKLFACISQHLKSPNNNVTASIYEFDSGQLGQTGLGPNNVKNNQLRAIAVNQDNNGFIVANAEQATRCGQIAADNDGNIYAPDMVGDFLFRYNPAGALAQPGGQVGDQVSEQTLADLKVSAWFNDAQLAGAQFGTSGITFDGNILRLFLENNGAQLFSLRSEGINPDGNLEDVTINQALAAPFGIAAVNDKKFIASDLNNDQLVILTDDNGTLNASVDLDTDDDNSFLQPGQVTVFGDVYVVVGTQLDAFNANQDQAEDAKVFIRRH